MQWYEGKSSEDQMFGAKRGIVKFRIDDKDCEYDGTVKCIGDKIYAKNRRKRDWWHVCELSEVTDFVPKAARK